jgi:hypothetical protein
VADDAMSKITTISYRGRKIYAYDIGRGVLLAEIARVAEESPAVNQYPWLAERLRTLRVRVLVDDYEFSLDADWPDEQELLVELIATANQRLADRKVITAQEAMEWRVLDNHVLPWRGSEPEPTAPIVDIGDAIIQLIRGTLPPDPSDGRHWCFGFPGGPQPI